MKISVMEFLDSQRMIQELVEVDFSTFSGLHPPASPLDMELLVRLEQKAQTYFENGQPIFFTNVPLLMQQYLAENAFSLYLLCEQNKPQQETLPEPQQETLPEPQQETLPEPQQKTLPEQNKPQQKRLPEQNKPQQKRLPEQNKPQQKRLPEQNKPQQKTKNKPQRSNTWLFGITNKLRPKWLSGISLILVLILIYWWNVEAKHQQKYQNLLSHAQKYENENKIYEARQFIKDVCSQNIEIQKLIELASKLDAKERQQ
ncbi:MAG: transcription factor TFIIIB component B'', partial [Parcubacteria group bacterium LiPW_30]